jgi:high-affinity iron transporter
LVIFLREGIEASMIIAILCAYLDRIGQRKHFVDVLAGAGTAFALATVGGVIAYYSIHAYGGSEAQKVFETATYLRNHARTISSELRAKTEAALDSRARSGLFLLAFQAVGREGLETVVFTLAIIFSASAKGAMLGAGIGLTLALVLAFAIYRFGTRVNIGIFFKAVGALLMVFAAGLLVDAVENLQELGWLPVLTHPLWNSAHALSEDSTFGDVVHSFFGYVSRPTPFEVATWVLYVGLVLTAFFGLWQRPRTLHAPAVPIGTENDR